MLTLVAVWLLGAGALSAQTKEPQIINWAPSAALQPGPGAAKALMMPQPAAPGINTVTFTHPPVTEMQSAAASQIAKQAYGGKAKLPVDGGSDLVIRTELPGVDLIFTREAENQLFDTIRAENQARPGAQRVIFPERGQVTRDKYAGRNFKQMVEKIEPSFVMHRRLNFENLNADRYGWEMGNLQPALSLGHFLYDVVALPYHSWTRPLQQWDSSAGKCLPGDAVPLQFYREPFSVTGLAAQTGAVFLGIAAFP